MRITVIGSGFVGRALARHWRRGGQHQITLTTTTAERVERLRGDADRVLVLQAADREGLRQALGQADVAVFCQAPTGDRLVDPCRYRATYCDPFIALAALLPDLPQLRQVVYTGSGSVYGDAAGGWVDETTPVAPADEHGQILLESEALLADCRSSSRRVCVLRLGAIHGPGRELTDRFARLAGSTRPGSGSHHCSWIHRDDVVGAAAAAVHHGWNEVVNLVDDQPWTVADLLDAVLRSRGLDPVQWDATRNQETSAADRRISNRRLHELGYQLRHPRMEFQLTAVGAAA